ncbi:Trichohyalin-plectin-homology_domain-containing protein [Hexamita inflata]|uniref:Meiosis-specific nuclear structural protein 1 n=1 Tax=Hexamita inflata TaxID=28002 RepID=A0AA86NC46_9EUKA|nr:Trichohyalin-plectin-homology domain-containing protein [Hexamita inflata]
MYSRQAMSDYYQKQQERDFQKQSFERYATDHTQVKAANTRFDRIEYKAAELKPQFSIDEQRMIDEYEKDLIEKARAEEENRAALEQAEAERRNESERIRLESKRKRILEQDQDLKDLRRAINAAETSKANHQMMFANKQKAEETRLNEQALEQQSLAELEARNKRIQDERDAKQLQIQQETYNFMLQMAEQKEAKRQAELYEKNEIERKLVQLEIQKALDARQQQIQATQNQHKQAVRDRDQFLRDKELVQKKEAERARNEEEQIKLHQQIQFQRETERANANKIRTLQFDALLQKMAETNRRREAKLQKMEDLRIEIAQFLEEEKQKQRYLQDQEQARKMRQDLVQAQEVQRQERLQKELDTRNQEEYYKNQALQQYKESMEYERAAELKKKQMLVQYREQAEEMLRVQREKREQEEVQRRLEEQKLAQEQWYDEESKQIVQEERERLIRECAAQVFDYMNAGTIKEEDIQLLPADLQEKIKQMRIDRQYQKSGVVGNDKNLVPQIPNREKIDIAKKELEQKKMAYKSALPW